MHRILILDDDSMSARLLAGYVTELQHEVRRTADTGEAWTTIRTWIPDLVIFDGDPNGLAGCDLVGRARQDPIFATLPFVVCAGVTRREVIDRYIRLRIQGIMVKPFDCNRVAMEIERANRRPFRAAFFKPLKEVMAQAMMDEPEVARMFRQVSGELLHILGEVSVLRDEPFNPAGLSQLFGLKSCGTQVGCPMLFQMAEEAVRAFNRLDPRPIRRVVEHIPVFARMLLRQAEDIEAVHGTPAQEIDITGLEAEIQAAIAEEPAASNSRAGSSPKEMSEEEAEFVRMVRAVPGATTAAPSTAGQITQ